MEEYDQQLTLHRTLQICQAYEASRVTEQALNQDNPPQLLAARHTPHTSATRRLTHSRQHNASTAATVTTLATNARLATRPAATVESKATSPRYVARRTDFMPSSQTTSTTCSYIRCIEQPTTWLPSRPRSMAPGSAIPASFQWCRHRCHERQGPGHRRPQTTQKFGPRPPCHPRSQRSPAPVSGHHPSNSASAGPLVQHQTSRIQPAECVNAEQVYLHQPGPP